MAEALTPMTELQAVNVMLRAVGVPPVSVLLGATGLDVQIAQEMLHNTSREFQAIGYHFNTEYNVPLTRNGNNHIPIAANSLSTRPHGSFVTSEWTERNGELYDLTARSPVFSSDVRAEVVSYLEFADLPHTAKNYFTLVGARRFQEKMLGSSELAGMDRSDERMARISFMHDQHKRGRYNVLQSNPRFARGVNRRRSEGNF